MLYVLLQEYGFNQMNSNDFVAFPSGQRFPGTMDYQPVGARQFLVERKWALGLQVSWLNSLAT